MLYQPHDYQKYAQQFIIDHPASFLIMDMGLGKTVVTLTALWELILDRFEVRKVLIIAPKRVAFNTWPQEMAKWEHLQGLNYTMITGTAKQRLEALSAPAHIYIINRENTAWLVNQLGKDWNFDTVVIDESSSFKNHASQRFKALKKVCPSAVKRVIALTGTPRPNNLLDLWPQVFLLDGGKRLGRFFTHYRNKFFEADKRSSYQIFSYKVKPQAEESIYQLIGDISLSMKAKDFLSLPDKLENKIELKLSPSERKAYDSFKQELVLSLQGQELEASNAAVLTNKLLQLANGAIYDGEHNTLTLHSRKLEALEDLIEAANGQPLLVAYWFHHDLERLQRHFPFGRSIDTSQDIEDWNAGRLPLAFLHPASAGHGLNLQKGGSTLVWFSLTWSLELYQQTNARLWRQGQESTVVIYHLVTKDTVDENILVALENKATGQEALIKAVKAHLGN